MKKTQRARRGFRQAHGSAVPLGLDTLCPVSVSELRMCFHVGFEASAHDFELNLTIVSFYI